MRILHVGEKLEVVQQPEGSNQANSQQSVNTQSTSLPQTGRPRVSRTTQYRYTDRYEELAREISQLKYEVDNINGFLNNVDLDDITARLQEIEYTMRRLEEANIPYEDIQEVIAMINMLVDSNNDLKNITNELKAYKPSDELMDAIQEQVTEIKDTVQKLSNLVSDQVARIDDLDDRVNNLDVLKVTEQIKEMYSEWYDIYTKDKTIMEEWSNNIENNIQDITSAIKETKENNVSLTNKVNDIEKTNETLRVQVDKIRQDSDDVKQETKSIKIKIESLVKENEALKEEIKSVKEDKKMLETTLEDFVRENQELKDRLEALEQIYADLQKQMESIRTLAQTNGLHI